MAVDSSRIGTTQAFVPGASAQSTAFGAQTYKIRVANGTTLAYIAIGTSPTATAADVMLPAGWVEYFTVTPGQKAAIFGTGGNLTITEVS